MPRGNLKKVDILARIYKLKSDFYDRNEGNKSDQWYEGSHYALNKVLDIINEYSN